MYITVADVFMMPLVSETQPASSPLMDSLMAREQATKLVIHLVKRKGSWRGSF